MWLSKPIDMLLFCPRCHTQHVDAPDPSINWTNPPHKSHECQYCKHTWRPADVPTNGVPAINTHGLKDGSPAIANLTVSVLAEFLLRRLRETIDSLHEKIHQWDRDNRALEQALDIARQDYAELTKRYNAMSDKCIEALREVEDDENCGVK